MLASFYWDNMIYFGMGPKPGPNGALGITFPMGKKKMAGISADDIGKCAYGIFKKGPEMIGKTVGIAGDQLTGDEMADALTKAIGQQVGEGPDLGAQQHRVLQLCLDGVASDLRRSHHHKSDQRLPRHSPPVQPGA